MEARGPACAGGRAWTRASPRPAPASHPATPTAEAWGPGRQGLWGVALWRSSLPAQRQGALGFGVTALPGGHLLGPGPLLPGPPEENDTATPWRRPRQGLGARGQGSAPRTKARARGPSTRGRRCWWGGLLLPTPTTQGHREKTLFAQKGELAPQDAAGAALSHHSLMWARLLILRRNGLEDS